MKRSWPADSRKRKQSIVIDIGTKTILVRHGITCLVFIQLQVALVDCIWHPAAIDLEALGIQVVFVFISALDKSFFQHLVGHSFMNGTSPCAEKLEPIWCMWRLTVYDYFHVSGFFS